MNQIDITTNVYCAIRTDQEMRNAAIDLRAPSRGIHIEIVGRNDLGDHRVRIIAPTRALAYGIRAQFMKLDK